MTPEEYTATENHLNASEMNQVAHEFLVHQCVSYHKEMSTATDNETKIAIGNKYMTEIYAYLLNLGRKAS